MKETKTQIIIEEKDLKNNGRYASATEAITEVMGDCFYSPKVIVYNNNYFKIKTMDHCNTWIYSITLKKLNKKELESLL